MTDRERRLPTVRVTPEWPIPTDVDRTDSIAVEKLVTSVFQAERRQSWQFFGHLNVKDYSKYSKFRGVLGTVRKLERTVERNLAGEVKMKRVVMVSDGPSEIKTNSPIRDLLDKFVENAPKDAK